jgi:hypothetical protein
MAALLGHADMVNFLSPWTKITEWDITEQVELFVTYASVGMYGKHKFLLFDFLVFSSPSLHGLIFSFLN